jgi:hypothetical protein
MAIITSDLFDDIKGKFGGAVFRRVHGKIIMSACPLKGSRKKSSKEQKAWRKIFGDLSTKTKKIKYDPGQRAEYAVKCPPNRALHNFIISELTKEAKRT